MKNKYTVENITMFDGLYSNNIGSVLQDHLGFLWLATAHGLQKYDGHTFTLYIPDSSDARTWELYEDKNKNLWIKMTRGLYRYSYESDDLAKYYFVNSENDTVSYWITSITEDLRGGLWVWIWDNGLYKINLENNTLVPHKIVNSWYHSMILKKGKQKGLYETWITFPSEYFGRKLQYKFVIKRKNGMLEWEPNPNPANPEHGNREIVLSGDSLRLAAEDFNSPRRIDQNEKKSLSQTSRKPTWVQFNLNLSNFEKPIQEGDEIQVKGDILPLTWGENISVNCLVFDSENELWMGSNNSGLFRFNLETGEYGIFRANPEIEESLSSNTINTGIRDQDNDLWFGTSRGLNKYDARRNTFETYLADRLNDPLNKGNGINNFDKIQEDRNGNIWIQSNSFRGIRSFNKYSHNKEITNYSEGFEGWISSVIRDQFGIVWLGDRYRGLYRLNADALKFTSFSIRKNGKDVLDGKPIVSVYEDQTGEIWIGGDLDGLYRYNRRTGKITIYKARPGYPDSLTANYVRDIFQSRNGTLWIATRSELCRFNPTTGEFKNVNLSLSVSDRYGGISCIYENRQGVIWMTTRGGYLVSYKPDTDETEFFSITGDADVDRQITFNDLLEDPQGFFWIATYYGGLLKFDLKTKKFSRVDKLRKYDITSIRFDNDGILWCGTDTQGLVGYDTKTGRDTVITEKDGLLINNIMGLEPDASGNLWLSTRRGLSRYNPRTGDFRHFFKEDGFLTDDFAVSAHSKCRNGSLMFGSTHGVVIFHPDSIRYSDYIPPIVLTDFKIQNKAVHIGENSPLKKHISVSDEIILDHDQNDISISFAALDFSHPARNQYSFFLENFEENWRSPGKEHTAYYTNLDPGEYTFRVRGTSGDGVWNEEGASLKIIITPPWWKTGWAYSLYALFILSMIYGFWRFQTGRLKMKQEMEMEHFEAEKLREVDHLKSRFFANISHEFRTPLTLILGPLQKFLSVTKERQAYEDFLAMQRNARRLQELMDQLLDLSKLDAQRMPLRTKLDNIVQKIRELTSAFSSLAETRNIELRFSADEESIIAYFDPDKLQKIIYNLLGNAFKFTPDGGKVTVHLSLRGDMAQARSTTYGLVEKQSLSFEGDEIASSRLVGRRLDSSRIRKDSESAHFVQISISDTGPGIAPDQLEHIFDRFYQVDEGSTRTHAGTGIGLALTQELVHLHHGQIRAESEEGKGSTFTILLPMGRDHLSDEEVVDQLSEEKIQALSQQPTPELVHKGISTPVADTQTAANTNGNPLILIVEDNQDMRRFLRNCLTECYDIIEAENGESGVGTAFEKIPDLIVSDVMMPDMDGLELCRKLKSDERTCHIPIILLTARASRESKVEGLETGADDYIVKPFDAEELRVRIKNLIDQRQKLRERFQREILLPPGQVVASSCEEKFLQRAMDIVQAQMTDADFGVPGLALALGMSRVQLHRKLNALTGLSASRFIRSLRLRRATELLKQRSGNVAEIAYEVGFNNVPYFHKCFLEQFGKTPAQYISPLRNAPDKLI
jgi:signal transduction histidine kinase/ligand-binding sensor domain-containing protein/DNA-binding response OmpR family regulator